MIELIKEITIDIELLSKAFGIQQSRLRDLFRSNGRMSSYILAPRIGDDLGYREIKEENAPAGLIDPLGKMHLIRTLTKNSGVNFAPQYMKGAGRHFDQEEFEEHLEKYAGFIIIDANIFPAIMIYEIKRRDVCQMDRDGELREGVLSYASFNHKANGGLGCLI